MAPEIPSLVGQNGEFYLWTRRGYLGNPPASDFAALVQCHECRRSTPLAPTSSFKPPVSRDSATYLNIWLIETKTTLKEYWDKISWRMEISRQIKLPWVRPEQYEPDSKPVQPGVKLYTLVYSNWIFSWNWYAELVTHPKPYVSVIPELIWRYCISEGYRRWIPWRTDMLDADRNVKVETTLVL